MISNEEHQKNLKDLIKKRIDLQRELESLQIQIATKRELFLKIQGIIEYLNQIGITISQEELDAITKISEIFEENESIPN